MSDPRRRGRPPKTKPPELPATITEAAAVNPTVPRSMTFGPKGPFDGPVPYDQAGYVGELIGPSPVKVQLDMKGRAFSDPIVSEEIVWPDGWRLPQAGEAIHLSRTFGGFVEYVDWWPTENRLVVKLR